MPTTPNIEAITTEVMNYLNAFTTKKSIGRPQIITAISKAVERLYTPMDAFMSSNNIQTIDLTNYVNVERLFAGANPFSSLDLSPLVNLKHLELFNLNGTMTSVDLSNNTALEIVNFQFSYGINSIDVSALVNLKELNIGSTSISALNISTNTLLEKLVFNNNTLSTLNISNNPLLTYLDFGGNVLSSAEIDSILATLVANNLNNGYVSLGGNNAPGSQGLTDKTTLEGRGWTVMVNS
ncbi:hypothetical protein GOQ30_11300 [Flavobacterium sp. TP390]|uniref:Leucine-rich repeat domain-containing protein n=1 Tax=Flavobacterium profundi TaxID=1774945 RepID=A0A6I4IJI7_9FLAO|nr:hypothetical protein [Flavobacterium profundi]MVO09744.1 hypothetical protein [Flavobacterium profundi]